jgi:hypothetical protein
MGVRSYSMPERQEKRWVISDAPKWAWRSAAWVDGGDDDGRSKGARCWCLRMGFGRTVATGPLRIVAFSIGWLDSAVDWEYNVFVIDIMGFCKS